MIPINFPLLIAGLLTIVGALVHIFAGEKTNIQSLLESNIPRNLKLELRGMWYVGSVVLALSGSVLLWLSFISDVEKAKWLIFFLALEFFLFSIVFFFLLLATGRDMLLKVPQWILLFAIGVLCAWGLI
ncbi:MAG: hypothetical protein ACXACI_07395 [Candidatus Hodarchaeales archaeon]